MGKGQNKEQEKEYFIKCLCETAEQLGRIPQKSDFPNEDMVRMKAYWGPWPHVLAAAGLVPSKEAEKAEKKRRRKERMKTEKQSGKDGSEALKE